jgi:pyruvate dehydrogenase E1 component
LEWLLLDGLAQLQEPHGEALYFRLSTKPVDQAPMAQLLTRRSEDAVRADILAGGFRIREPGVGEDRVILASCGAMVPDTLAAAAALAEEEGVAATVIVCSSPGLLYRNWRVSRTLPVDEGSVQRLSHLERLILPSERGVPVVSVIDGHSHSLAWLGSALGSPCIPLGVDGFGQSGSQPEVYSAYGISSDAIVTAALAALAPIPD